MTEKEVEESMDRLYEENYRIIRKHLKNGCYRELFDQLSREWNASTIDEKIKALENILKEVDIDSFILGYEHCYSSGNYGHVLRELPYTLGRLLSYKLTNKDQG